MSLSVNTGGPKVLRFTQIPTEDANHETLQDSREALGVPTDGGFISWTRANLLANCQKGQAEIVLPDLASPVPLFYAVLL